MTDQSVIPYGDNAGTIAMQAEYDDQYPEWRVYMTVTYKHPVYRQDGNKMRIRELLAQTAQPVIRDLLIRLPPSLFPDQVRQGGALSHQSDLALAIAAAQFAELFDRACIALREFADEPT